MSVVPCFLQNFVNQVIKDNIKAHVHGFKSAINEWIADIKSLHLTLVHSVNSNLQLFKEEAMSGPLVEMSLEMLAFVERGKLENLG